MCVPWAYVITREYRISSVMRKPVTVNRVEQLETPTEKEKSYQLKGTYIHELCIAMENAR